MQLWHKGAQGVVNRKKTEVQIQRWQGMSVWQASNTNTVINIEIKVQIQIKKTQIQTISSMIGFDKHQIQKQTQIQLKVRIHRWQGLSVWQASKFHRHCSKQNKPLRPQTFKMSKFWQEWTQDDWWKCGFLEKASECSLPCVCLNCEICCSASNLEAMGAS